MNYKNIKHYYYEDTFFPKSDKYTTRIVARGFIKTPSNNFAFHHIQGKDLFGLRDYYETPGGGVEENETIEEGLKREIFEELGYEIKNIKPLAKVTDFYNAISRKNEIYYFIAEIDGDFQGLHHVSKGDNLIESTIWCDLETALFLYKSKNGKRISSLVCQREIPLIEELIKCERLNQEK